jgi:site-specific recombinase XerD
MEMMNFIPSSINYDPVRLAEFLEWMEENGVSEIEDITGKKVKLFFEELSHRKAIQTGEVLSLATQKNYLTIINRFARYLRQANIGHITVPVHFKGKSAKPIVVLTSKEINRIYAETGDDLLSMRDRAMLGVFYGCGLRRGEGAELMISDVLFDMNLLYVRKGKGNKERYVPMIGAVRNDIRQYVQIARPQLMRREAHEYLFVAVTGKKIGSAGLYERFKKLLKKTGMKKKAGLHTLRHSIATHLLSRGMKLSDIAKFLGHRSLESTQIYTHIEDEKI